MRRALLIALLCLTALPAAGAADAPPAAPELGADTSSCVTGLTAADRSATFTASMPADDGASVLAMRFTLQRFRAGAWRSVPARTFGRWERSTPGALGLKYAKHVQQLDAPAAYRAVVRFRWLDADGATVREEQLRTRACREPERRPDLQPVRIVPGPIGADGAVTYALTVRNTGATAAPASRALLSVGSIALTTQDVDALAPGATATVSFSGPPCQPGEMLRAAADDSDTVDEADEGDNVLVQRCVAG